MNRTETPPLDDGALHRLWDYTELFRPDFRFRRQAEGAAVYVRALLQDGERKSVEPLAGRVPLPPALAVGDPVQAMQNFVNQSPWDEQKIPAGRQSVRRLESLRRPSCELSGPPMEV